MTISKNNIEAYLLDYLEGNLNPLLTAELMAFLAENPEYENWLPEYDFHTGSADGPPFEEKIMLKKDFRDIPVIDGDNFEEFCIASAEGLLQERDIARLDDYLSQHPEKIKIHSVYARLKLQSDCTVTYPDKSRLKKRTRHNLRLRPFYYVMGAAASLALLLMLVSRKPAVTIYTDALPALPRVESGEGSSAPVRSKAENNPVLKEKKRDGYHPAYTVLESKETAPAAVSTDDNDLTPLAVLEPIRSTLRPSDQPMPGITMYARPLIDNSIHSELDTGQPAGKREPSLLFAIGSRIKKLNFWNAAGTAISGFNYMTESQVSLTKTTDESGKMTGLALDTQEFIISGSKIK
jgi:hypothetical protein